MKMYLCDPVMPDESPPNSQALNLLIPRVRSLSWFIIRTATSRARKTVSCRNQLIRKLPLNTILKTSTTIQTSSSRIPSPIKSRVVQRKQAPRSTRQRSSERTQWSFVTNSSALTWKQRGMQKFKAKLGWVLVAGR